MGTQKLNLTSNKPLKPHHDKMVTEKWKTLFIKGNIVEKLMDIIHTLKQPR